MRIIPNKSLRSAEWAKDSKPSKAVADLMSKHGIAVLVAGHGYNVPDDLGKAIVKANAGEEA